MRWLIEMLLRTRRLRGLSESQLQDLINSSTDVESLQILKQHLESGSFKFGHLQARAPDLIQKCIERAQELEWQAALPELKRQFLERLSDLL